MFKETFKYYKTKLPVPDLSAVIEFDKITPEKPSEEVEFLDLSDECFKISLPHGVKPIHTWHCYRLKKPAGLIVIRNPFTTQGQRYWMARCIRDFPKHPNKVNLNENLFNQAVLDDWWGELQKTTDKDEARRMKISMRWATLGYHHNWDTKVYSEEMRTEFPKDLAEMSNFFVQVLGFDNFAAQAAIINFYPIGSTLSGHRDDSEVNLEAPLISVSFGQSSIFLIGSESKDTRPTALLLQSGDILIMSHESRLCYHAVPRVMKALEEPWNDLIVTTRSNSLELPSTKKLRIDFDVQRNICGQWHMDMHLYDSVSNDSFWLPFKQYLNDTRVNINVRQVLHNGLNKLQN